MALEWFEVSWFFMQSSLASLSAVCLLLFLMSACCSSNVNTLQLLLRKKAKWDLFRIEHGRDVIGLAARNVPNLTHCLHATPETLEACYFALIIWQRDWNHIHYNSLYFILLLQIVKLLFVYSGDAMFRNDCWSSGKLWGIYGPKTGLSYLSIFWFEDDPTV